MKIKEFCIGISVVLLFFLTLVEASEKRVYWTELVTGNAPVIDGYVNDRAWDHVEWSGDFIQREPDEGKPPSQETAFKILYDARYLYVAYRCFDTEPDKISHRMSRRDGFDGDWVEINIDSYFDHRTAFSFTSCVSGVMSDEFISNDGHDWDVSWDPVWYFKSRVDDEGWTAEARIPLSQLRFSNKAEQVWGIQINRRLFRMEERSSWQEISRNETGWVSQFGELRGLKDIKPQRQVELLPYAVGQYERYAAEEGNPYATGEGTEIDAGLDGKIGITSDLTLDFTINPDFGQVEADPSEVNLTAFETFFQEKRPFFIEGRNILNYKITQAMFGGDYSSDTLFYSRRIGRSPQGGLYSDPDSNYYVDYEAETTILGALKLTGKTKNGLSMGFLECVTDEEQATIDDACNEYKEIIEPRSSYFVTRLQQDYNQGNTLVGGIFTATNRDSSVSDQLLLHDSAYTGGIDYYHRWFENNYYLSGNVIVSKVSGSKETILETQTSSTHYFQRPDAEHLSVDENLTSLSGYGGTARVGKSAGGYFRFESGATWRSPGLELNDMGYLRATDRINSWTWFGYSRLQPFSVFNQFNLNMNGASLWDFSGENKQHLANINIFAKFRNNWHASSGISYNGEKISDSVLRGGPSLKLPGGLSYNLSVNSDSRKKATVNFGSWGYFGDQDTSRSQSYWFLLSLRPSNAISISFNPTLDFKRDDMEYVTTTETEGGEDRYIFARIEQTTLRMNVRLNYSISPTLSIQFYGQPFISSGSYSQFKRITDPRAGCYGDRYHQFSDSEWTLDDEGDYHADENSDGDYDYTVSDPDFTIQYFISNLIVRWEYLPGSTLFLVWSQNRDAYLEKGNFAIKDDVNDLFSIQPHNLFMIKLNFWLSL